MKKRLLSVLLALMLLLSLVPAASAAQSALFTEFLTTGKLEAPKAPYVRVIAYDDGYWGDTIDLWVMVPSVLRQINSAGESWDEAHPDGSDMVFNRFGVHVMDFEIQTDGRVDGGAWQYTSEWDTPDFWSIEGVGDYVFAAARDMDTAKAFASLQLADVGSWYTGGDVNNTGFLAPMLTPFQTEEGGTAFHFDLTNHTLGVRSRIVLKYQDEEGGEIKMLISDWSPETSVGKNGTQKTLAAPTGIEAPVLSQFTLTIIQEDGMDVPQVKYFITIPDSVYQGLMYCEAQAGMFEPYCIETQIRVSGGAWVDFYTGNPVWIFDGLRGGSPDNEYPFTKDSQVEIRARIVCSELGLTSPWSNVVGNKPTFTAAGWAQGELAQADALGLIPASLKEADLTRPITRAEFAAVSVKVYEALTGQSAQPEAVNPFKDTSDPEVLKAYHVGITNGTDMAKGLFSPDVLLPREQAATMLTRVYKKTLFEGWTLATDSAFNDQFKALFTMPETFSDDAQISSWAKDSVYFMAANGIIKGSEGKFMPKATTDAEKAIGYAQATRQEALLIAVRLVKNLG